MLLLLLLPAASLLQTQGYGVLFTHSLNAVQEGDKATMPAAPDSNSIHVQGPVFTEGRAYEEITLNPLLGLPPAAVIEPDSALILDSAGSSVTALNSMETVPANGSIQAFQFTPTANLSEGPFSLNISVDNSSYSVALAGVVSMPASHPQIFLTDTHTVVNSTLTVICTGFQSLQLAGYPVIGNYTAGTDENCNSLGALYMQIAVPEIPGGNYTFWFTGAPEITTLLTIEPSAALTPDSVRPGQIALLVIEGVITKGSVVVNVSGSIAGRFAANDAGILQLAVRIPVLPSGTHIITATEEGGISCSALFSVYMQTAELSETHGTPGSKLTILGEGYAPGEEIQFSFGGRIISNETASASGEAAVNMDVPEVHAGLYTVALHSSNGTVSAVFEVQPELAIDERSFFPTSFVQVFGYYFPPASTAQLFIDNVKTATVRDTGNGSFMVSLKVPTLPGGAEILYASSEGILTPGISVDVRPLIEMSAYRAGPGQTVTVRGFGFAPQSTIPLTINGNYWGKAETSGNGTFSDRMPAPLLPGPYVIEAGGAVPARSELYVSPPGPAPDFLLPFMIPALTGILAVIFEFSQRRKKL